MKCALREDKLFISLNTFQMRYDQVFVKACSSDRTKLKDAQLSPTVICPEFTIKMALPSFTNILHKLEDLLVFIL